MAVRRTAVPAPLPPGTADVPSRSRPRTVGPAEGRAQQVINRYAATLRGLAGVSAAVLGLLATPVSAQQRPICAVVLLWAIARLIAFRSQSRWWTTVDLLVAVGVGLTAPLTVTPAQAAQQQAFVANVVNPANLTFAWFPRRRPALVLCAVVIATTVTGTALATGAPLWTLLALFTMPLQAALSWALVGVFLPAARAADRAADQRAEALVDRDLVAARRAASWEHWTLLHDTAASTLVMVGDGVPASATARIRRQARRDLMAIDRLAARDTGEPTEFPELVETIRRCVAESPLPVDLSVTGQPGAPADVVAAVGRAVRELLTNVERHSGAERVQLTVRGDHDGVVVVVRDAGVGFEPAGPADPIGRGLRESVVGRLDRVGVRTDIASGLGSGTSVTLTWRPAAPADPSDPADQREAEAGGGNRSRVPYLRNFGVGLSAVSAVVVLQFAAVAVLSDAASATASLLAGSVLLVATGGALWRMARGRTWTRGVTCAWLAAVLATSTLYTLALPAGGIARPANWVLGATPYVVVVLLTGRRLRWSVLAVALPVLLDAVLLATGGGLTQLPDVVAFGQQAIGLTIFPLAAAAFYPRLAEVARSTAAQDAARVAVQSRERQVAALDADRAERAATVSATVAPLIRALADGSADPRDATVRRAARIESARLRRMFAETDEVDDPVVHEVRASIEAGERTGVVASLDVHGVAPALPVDVRRRLLEAPMALLARAADSARVVVDASDRLVTVSVVARIAGSVTEQPMSAQGGVTVRYVTHGGAVWVQSSWEPPS